jgi:hypothetical protein
LMKGNGRADRLVRYAQAKRAHACRKPTISPALATVRRFEQKKICLTCRFAG